MGLDANMFSLHGCQRRSADTDISVLHATYGCMPGRIMVAQWQTCESLVCWLFAGHAWRVKHGVWSDI